MNLDNYQNMDINMLFSIINMKLRDEDEDLAGLCARYAIKQDILVARLAEKSFLYDPQTNQFKAH